MSLTADNVEGQSISARRNSSCMLQSHTTSCVDKAVEKMQQLQQLIYTLDMTASDTQGEGRQCARFTTSVNHDQCGSKPTLSVEGVGAETNASPVNMSAILSSVMKLVKRLKTDKEVTAKLLSTEREKSYVLEKKVSQFSAQRLNVLPEAAEKVHRTRVMDIMELEWHTSYQKRIEAQIKPKVTRAEKLNTRLKADIAFVNKHCPLIEGKLKLQEEDMQKIDEAQEQATQELNDVLLSYGAAEEHSSQEHEKGESERLSISKKLRDANRKLKNVCAELQYCQDLHASYIQQAEESRVKIKTTAADLQEKLDTDTKLDEDESAIAASVKALDKKRKCQEKDISGLQLQIKLLGEERDKQIAAWKSALTDMQNTVHQTASKLRAIVNSSKVHQITTDDTLENISEIKKKVAADEKAIEQIRVEALVSQVELHQLTDDCKKAVVVNQAQKKQLRKNRDHNNGLVEMQKMKVDGVLKQVKLEAQACKALSARIDSETVMQEKLRSDSKNKEEVLRDMAESLEAQVAVLQAGVTEAKQKLSSRQQSIVTLQERITAVVAEHKMLCQELQLKIDENLLPLEKQMKTVDESHGFQLASVAEKSRTINENISKMNGTWAMLQRNLVTAEDTVNTLNATMDTIQEQLDREQSFVKHVLDSTTEVQGRIQDKTAQHENYLQKRHAILGQQKKDLASSVEKNRKLALQYRQQQNEHLLTKACYIQTFDERWYFQLTNNDLKQILMLENRFRVNTDKYNSLRQHLHTMEIQQYGASSACNSQAVHHLEKAIMDATQSMTERVREELHIHSLKYRRNIKNLANTEPIPPIKTYCSVPVQEHLIVQNTYAGNKLAENVTPVQN